MKNHDFFSLARISLPRGAAVYISYDSQSVGPKSNTPTVGNLTTSCGHEVGASDAFGPEMLKICSGRALPRYSLLVGGCLSFILVRVSCPGHCFGASYAVPSDFFENVNFRKFHEILKLVRVQTTEIHKFSSLARISLSRGAGMKFPPAILYCFF